MKFQYEVRFIPQNANFHQSLYQVNIWSLQCSLQHQHVRSLKKTFKHMIKPMDRPESYKESYQVNKT